MVLVSRDDNSLRGAALVVQRVLSKSGIAVLERVMGLILAAIAVQLMADGARDLWGR
jgi:multiple antibiotic resistance protein